MQWRRRRHRRCGMGAAGACADGPHTSSHFQLLCGLVWHCHRAANMHHSCCSSNLLRHLTPAHTCAPQVATAATLSAAGLEAFRMLFASMEQPDGTFGGGAPAVAAAAAGRAFVRSFPPLLVLLPAVAAAAVSGGALGHAALPASVAWGLLAAAAACSGGGAVLDQLLWRPLVSTRAAVLASGMPVFAL